MIATQTKLDKFTRAYVECALWSSTNNTRDDGGDPLDRNYTLDDIAAESLARIVSDCEQFQARYPRLLETLDDRSAGHDFWLTRNRHGAGYWDRGYGKRGELLTRAAHSFGEVWLYVGDDGALYLA